MIKKGERKSKYPVILLGVVLFLLLLFFLSLPGIQKNGIYLKFNTQFKGAALFINGKYSASIPCEVFIPSGIAEIEIRAPFYRTIQIVKKISGRVFL
ncbi:hypothetical protein KAS50_05545, partial [bacterium]|nr:hypothetical protein [bacterium]